VGPLGLCNGAFDDYVIYLSIIVSALLLSFKVDIGAFGDREDCVMSRESFICCWGSWICGGGGGGGLASILTWEL
jgi:hypothetical protein